MKKNFLLVLFVLLSTFNYTVGSDVIRAWIPKDHVQIPNVTNSVTTIRLTDDKKEKLTKKELKNEIKRRKKYHKSLVTAYNESFSEEYLSLIQENSRQLTAFRALL